MNNNTEYRVIKLDKRLFKVEYRNSLYGAWHEAEKNFKSVTKANEYIAMKSVEPVLPVIKPTSTSFHPEKKAVVKKVSKFSFSLRYPTITDVGCRNYVIDARGHNILCKIIDNVLDERGYCKSVKAIIYISDNTHIVEWIDFRP